MKGEEDMSKTYVLEGPMLEWEGVHEPVPVEGADRHFDSLEVRIQGLYSEITIKCGPEQTDGEPLFPSILRALAKRPGSVTVRCSIELDDEQG